jgi:C1A family cysteine protease
MLGRLKSLTAGTVPASVDLREYFAPVEDQQGLNSATAQACVALVDYFQRRARGIIESGSVRFVYKMTRKLLHASGDSGSDLRTVLKAIVRFGIPPAQHCPYDVERFDEEPDPFLYRLSPDMQSMLYVRLDPANVTGAQTLATVRAFLAAGFPVVLGFSIPSSISNDGDILWRPLYDSVIGGQAVVAVGYDDDRLYGTKGSLLIRNSWGSGWGDGGYGWLPYRFVEHQHANDCWTALRPDWLESGEFLDPGAT